MCSNDGSRPVLKIKEMSAVTILLTDRQYAALPIWINEYTEKDDPTSYVHPKYSNIDNLPHEWDIIRANGRMVITGNYQSDPDQYSISILISDPPPDFAQEIARKLVAECNQINPQDHEATARLLEVFEE